MPFLPRKFPSRYRSLYFNVNLRLYFQGIQPFSRVASNFWSINFLSVYIKSESRVRPINECFISVLSSLFTSVHVIPTQSVFLLFLCLLFLSWFFFFFSGRIVPCLRFLLLFRFWLYLLLFAHILGKNHG